MQTQQQKQWYRAAEMPKGFADRPVAEQIMSLRRVVTVLRHRLAAVHRDGQAYGIRMCADRLAEWLEHLRTLVHARDWHDCEPLAIRRLEAAVAAAEQLMNVEPTGMPDDSRGSWFMRTLLAEAESGKRPSGEEEEDEDGDVDAPPPSE